MRTQRDRVADYLAMATTEPVPLPEPLFDGTHEEFLVWSDQRRRAHGGAQGIDMAKMRCLCDRVLNTGVEPNTIQYRLVSVETWPETGEGAVDYAERVVEVSRVVWRCPACRRMAVFEPGAAEAQWYEPATESTQPGRGRADQG